MSSLASIMWPFLAIVALAQGKCYVGGKEVPCQEALQTLQQYAGLGLGMVIAFFVVAIATTVFWIMMLVHAITKPIQNKTLWVILLIIFGIVAAIIYYFVVKRKFSQVQPMS